ncbi:WD40 repeat domain-containing protein [Aspergillus undulatus]|uniref:WD40 repeat domain-containing protein n=1 Tax=Aspergillus undulatus TaxID=1810928 RepID=UPI003CCE1C8C
MELIRSKPRGLDKLYDDLMNKIEKEQESSVQFCKNVLVAACLAHRPLSLPEVGVCAGLPARVPAAVIAGKYGSFLVTRDDTVYPIHQSAREYLETNYAARPQQGGPAQGHAEFSQRAIHAMTAKLAANMYILQPATLSEDIKPPRPDPLASIRYSCEFWVDHLCAVDIQSMPDGNQLGDSGGVFTFLQNHLLHWLESLSLVHNLSAGVRSIKKLLSAVQSSPNKSSELVAFLKDAEKFVVRYRPAIEGAPLQIYGAPLALCPTNATVKEWYWEESLPLIKAIAGVKNGWDSSLQTLEHGYQFDHSSGIPMEHVTFSPDGKTLAVASLRNVRLWDTATGFCKRIIEFKRPFSGFSPDSKTLTLVSAYGQMQTWNVTTSTSNISPDRSGQLWEDDSASTRIGISPDGNTIVKGLNDGTLEIWDATSGAFKKTPGGCGSEVVSITFSSDGKSIASAAKDGPLQVWDTATAACGRTLENPDSLEICALSFSPDGKTLASASRNGIHLWNLDNGHCKVLVEGHRGSCIAFSSDGRTVASDAKHCIKLFNAATGAWVKALEGHTETINSLAFSPDSQKLASASNDFRARVWDTTAIAGDQPVEVTTEIFRNIALSPDSKTIALGTDSTVQLRDTASSVCTRTLYLPDLVNSMAFSPDGKAFATASFELIQIWDLATGNCNHKAEGYTTPYIAFSPDSRLLAAVSLTLDPPHTVKLLDVATGDWTQTLESIEPSNIVAFSPDGKIVAALTSSLEFWDAGTGTSKKVLNREHSASSM